jgi:hypothetical protein
MNWLACETASDDYGHREGEMTQPVPPGSASGFHIASGPRGLTLRNYDGESVGELAPLFDLVHELLTDYKVLIPGKLFPLIGTWHDELATVLAAKLGISAAPDAGEAEEPAEAGTNREPADRYRETGGTFTDDARAGQEP